MLHQFDLAQFTGTQAYHSLGLTTVMTKVLMSDGALHVAKEGGAFWLMDEIAFAIKGLIESNERLERIQFWKLEKLGHTTKLTCVEDSGMPPSYVKNIRLTDFPLDSIDLWVSPCYIGETKHWLIYLPSEH